MDPLADPVHACRTGQLLAVFRRHFDDGDLPVRADTDDGEAERADKLLDLIDRLHLLVGQPFPVGESGCQARVGRLVPDRQVHGFQCGADLGLGKSRFFQRTDDAEFFERPSAGAVRFAVIGIAAVGKRHPVDAFQHVREHAALADVAPLGRVVCNAVKDLLGHIDDELRDVVAFAELPRFGDLRRCDLRAVDRQREDPRAQDFFCAHQKERAVHAARKGDRQPVISAEKGLQMFEFFLYAWFHKRFLAIL